jgi:secondary thiamine-phosphate synthase enzyme
MIIKIKHLSVITNKQTELINITQDVQDFIESTSIANGVVFVISMHTTTGMIVNEGIPDLESDITSFYEKIVPEDLPYHHSRFLPFDGQMGINATSHIRSTLMGFEIFFPIEGGKIQKGSRQNIYFVELDGPQERTFIIQVIGEKNIK